MHRLLAVVALTSSLAACGSSETYGPPQQLIPPPTHSNFIVYVSNQSFDIDPVDVAIEIDGRRLVEGDFLVEGQHNWLRFDFYLDPGDHELVAISSESPIASQSITTTGDPRYAVVNFWYYPPGSGDPTGPELAVDIYDEQPYFE